MEDIYVLIDELSKKVDKLLARDAVPVKGKQELYKALSLAQAEMSDVLFSGENVHYKDKYATLADLVRMSRPALTNHGLCVFQDIYRSDEEVDTLRTTLAHSSGQTIQTEMRLLPNKNHLHVIGSYLAYIRRISYASLLGIMVHDLDDDDANLCSKENIERLREGKAPELSSEDTQTQEYKRLTKAQVAELEKAMGTHYDLGQDLLDKYGVDGFGELPASKYSFVLSQMRKNKAYREQTLE